MILYVVRLASIFGLNILEIQNGLLLTKGFVALDTFSILLYKHFFFQMKKMKRLLHRTMKKISMKKNLISKKELVRYEICLDHLENFTILLFIFVLLPSVQRSLLIRQEGGFHLIIIRDGIASIKCLMLSFKSEKIT